MKTMPAVAIVFLLFALGDAFAQAVPPPAVYRLTVQAGSEIGGPAFAPTYSSSVPGTLSSNGSNEFGNGTTSLTVSPYPAPMIVITGSEGGNNGVIQSLASVNWYGYATNPLGDHVPNKVVPVNVTGQIVTNVTAFNAGNNDLTASADFQVGNVTLAAVECTHISGCGVVNFSTTIYFLSADQSENINNPSPTSIYMSASLLGVTQPDGATGRSFIDPVFTIDPVFAAANPGYSLVFSDGIGNFAAPIPEPETYSLMLSGIALLGYSIRRKNKYCRNV